MAGCAWIAARFPAEANVQLRDDGTARVACGTTTVSATSAKEENGQKVATSMVFRERAEGQRGMSRASTLFRASFPGERQAPA